MTSSHNSNVIGPIEEVTDDVVAEWVGQSYLLHFESLSAERQQEFRERYAESMDQTQDEEDTNLNTSGPR